MTIDDELIYELIKPDRYGKVGKDALIVKVVGTRKIDYKLEEPTSYWERHRGKDLMEIKREVVKITPDITVTLLNQKGKQIAIELENDIHWDFQESLRQVKKYKGEFDDTRVIIPKQYEKFAPLYKNEEFRVWIWKAKRQWQCLRCGTINEKEGPFPPKCKGKACKSKNLSDYRLVGLKDTKIEEYT